jgi:hypothetical protein
MLSRWTYDSENGENLDIASSSLLEDGSVVIFETQVSIKLFG